MSRRPAGLLIEDMLERIRRIERSVAGMDHEAFLRNDTAIDAVIRNLTVLSHCYRPQHVTRLVLFGSCARGQQTETSDEDILVEVDPSIGLRFVDRPLLVVTSAGAGWRSGSNHCSAFTRTWSPAGPSPRGTGR